MTKIRRTFAEHPWLFVVLALVLFVGLSMTFLTIALSNPPRLVG